MAFNVYDSKVTKGSILNMKAVCVIVGKLFAELKFFKCRSKVTVNAT